MKDSPSVAFDSLQSHGQSPPTGSSIHGIFRARVLEGGAISSSRGSSWLRDCTCIACVSCFARWIVKPLSHQRGSQSMWCPSKSVWRASKWVTYQGRLMHLIMKNYNIWGTKSWLEPPIAPYWGSAVFCVTVRSIFHNSPNFIPPPTQDANIAPKIIIIKVS